MAPKKETTEIAQRPRADVLDSQSDLAALIGGDAGAGMEGTDKDSFAIPFLRVLQQLSPQCTPGKTGYNPKARPGMLFNTVTGELTPGEVGVIFQPCAFQRRFIQWGARSAGGGYKGEFLPEDIAARQSAGEIVKSEDDGKLYFDGKNNPKKDDFFSDTRNHYGLVNGVQMLISLSSTQIKKSKQLMGILSAVRVKGQMPPTWLNRIRITTVQESNDQGSWHGFRMEQEGFIETAAEYEAGKAFHHLISEGAVRVEYKAENDASDDQDNF